jgi:phage shock protein PspC (stress-responsive transcriptional regulator)
MAPRRRRRDRRAMTSPSPSAPRRLTRSTTDKKLAGVAGGLAEYFDVDPALMRIAFALSTLFSGAGIVAYVLVMLFVPADDDAPASAHPAIA